jgi:hypothetical protein
LYYSDEFKPVLNYSMATILAGLSPQVSAKLISEGLYSWYTNELDRLKQRIQGAHSTDMDRGSRIMAYYRLLQEYKKLSGVGLGHSHLVRTINPEYGRSTATIKK